MRVSVAVVVVLQLAVLATVARSQATSGEDFDVGAFLRNLFGAVLNQTSTNSSTLGQQKVTITVKYPPQSGANSQIEQAPLDITGKWTSMLINKKLLYESSQLTGNTIKDISRELYLKDDATYTAQYDTSQSNPVISGGNYKSKEGFWSVDEMSGMLYLQVTFCEEDSFRETMMVITFPYSRHDEPCPTDDEQYQLSQAKQIDEIFLGDDKYLISDIDG
eukprot:TRINITY_DN750_c0_g1_i12.p1 TRINITY_DN750_c0_g1~~TRINITY_DN750_c0_g1_i12.p1  ORF type:complete len:219 (-),score=25.63 TRINITY_DN750_c0_g1_i12:472-1128(-)